MAEGECSFRIRRVVVPAELFQRWWSAAGSLSHRDPATYGKWHNWWSRYYLLLQIYIVFNSYFSCSNNKKYSITIMNNITIILIIIIWHIEEMWKDHINNAFLHVWEVTVPTFSSRKQIKLSIAAFYNKWVILSIKKSLFGNRDEKKICQWIR